jgi:hypothetical protein
MKIVMVYKFMSRWYNKLYVYFLQRNHAALDGTHVVK